MASGWWDNNGAISGCVAAYQPIGAASLAASYSNKANPGTYDAAPGTAPTFAAATGWTFNGSTQYLTTGVTPSNNQAYSVLVRYSDRVDGSGYSGLVGAGQSSPAIYWGVALGHVGDQSIYYSNGFYAQKVTVPVPAADVVGFAGVRAYRSGSDQGIAIAAGPAGSLVPMVIGCSITGTSRSQYCHHKIQAVAIYSGTLTAGEVATLTTAMNALPVASGSALPLFAAQIAVMS